MPYRIKWSIQQIDGKLDPNVQYQKLASIYFCKWGIFKKLFLSLKTQTAWRLKYRSWCWKFYWYPALANWPLLLTFRNNPTILVCIYFSCEENDGKMTDLLWFCEGGGGLLCPFPEPDNNIYTFYEFIHPKKKTKSPYRDFLNHWSSNAHKRFQQYTHFRKEALNKNWKKGKKCLGHAIYHFSKSKKWADFSS